jgi:hypothetical protein
MKAIPWLLLLFAVGGCTQKYVSPYHLPATANLVVEGFVNVGNGPTNFTLSRASSLDSPVIIPQTGAQVIVETQGGGSFPLTELGNGNYSFSQIPVDLTQQYRLRITTPDGKEYLSDFAMAKLTPPVDSVSWKLATDGINIYVSSHDPQNNTRYYQWKYEETWKYTSAYPSGYEYKNGAIVSRPDSDDIFTCWKSVISTDISIATSAALNADIIYEFPLTQVLFSSNKLVMKYSILVKQYALTEDWYNWIEKLQKNTERLGSIFDAQPSEIAGNLHCISNPDEQVIGFVGCTSETEERIFISRDQLPGSQVIYSGYESCTLDTLMFTLAETFGNGSNIPVDISGSINTIKYSSAFCVDCRQMGGTVIEPPFWQ